MKLNYYKKIIMLSIWSQCCYYNSGGIKSSSLFIPNTDKTMDNVNIDCDIEMAFYHPHHYESS